VLSLPSYFRTDTYIEGISATDIFTLSATLSAAIETQLVSTLNRVRTIWDPHEQFQLYSFVRQPQTFPDVRLQRAQPTKESDNVLLGIELKAWYLLSKEKEPSFRFQVTPDACAIEDIIVVVPWALDNVISGRPKLFVPFVDSAKYAAEYRNYHWKHLMSGGLKREIESPFNARPYPVK